MTETEKVRHFLESLYDRYNMPAYIPTDPIKFPHRYESNREFVAFTSALFAYGNVKAIQGFLESFFETCGTDPLSLQENPEGLKYRFQSPEDVTQYCRVVKDIYCKYGSLEAFFYNGNPDPMKAAYEAIEKIKQTWLQENSTHGLNFLFALPGKSASKRLVMFLRWMVREDEVDFGLWKTSFSQALLPLPVDVHMQRMAANMGIINSGEKGAQALGKVTAFFQGIMPEDPARYDFALTRLGIVGGCQYRRSEICKGCNESEKCLFN